MGSLIKNFIKSICGIILFFINSGAFSEGAESLKNDPIAAFTMLDANFFKMGDIVSDSKKKKPEANFAIVLIKTHRCDNTSNTCADITRVFVDPYNDFIQSNFALYHTALTPNLSQTPPEVSARIPLEDEKVQDFRILSGARDIAKEWITPEGERVIVVDISQQKIIGRFHFEPKGHNTSFERLENMRYLKSKLLEIPEVAVALKGKPDQLDRLTELECKDPVCGVPEVQQAVLRQLMKRPNPPVSPVSATEILKLLGGASADCK